MILFKIDYAGFTPRVAKRKLNGLTRASFDDIGHWWQRTALPKHFTHAGATLYGYARRQGERVAHHTREWRLSYTRRKLRKFGHTYPLVFSGRSRALAKTGVVRATRNRVRVSIPAPALNRPHPSGRIFMREEVTTVSEDEKAIVAERFTRTLTNGLNNLPDRSTVTIGRRAA